MTNHNDQSVYREKIIEHIFVSELLKYDWKHGGCKIDILKPEIDRFGYDILVTRNSITRYIQLKTSLETSPVGMQKIHVNLLNTINGSIIWIVINDDLIMKSFKVIIPSIGTMIGDSNFKMAKHSKSNSDGLKTLRPNIREIPKARFTETNNFNVLFKMLFPDQNESAQQGDAPEPDSSRSCLPAATSRPGDL